MLRITEPPLLDRTGLKIVDALNYIGKQAGGEGQTWGFIEDNDILDPEKRITYIGDAVGKVPMAIEDAATGRVNEGTWGGFIEMLDNHPWMVNFDGVPDYRLQDNDYTKKLDGSASDVSNTNYKGGAYAWIRRIYKSETTIGSKRIVSFSFVKRDNYEPIGFVDSDNNVLEGVWIPMFYGSPDGNGKMRSLAGMQPSYNHDTNYEHTAISACGARHRFYGGGIAKTLEDIEIMLCKSSNVPGVIGTGNCSGYNEAATPAGTNGVLANAVLGNGRWFGTTTGKQLNKYFHSIVLGSYQQWMRDPYCLLVNGEYKVSKNYTYDLSGNSFEATGIKLPESGGIFYPHFYKTIPGFGSVPINSDGYKGSTSLGGCDGFWVNISGVMVSRRFGDCGNGLNDGPRFLGVSTGAGGAYWSIGAADLLLPPAGVSA